MTDEHKAAIAEGREQNRSVRIYLEAIEGNKPKRGRKRSPESIAQRLTAIEAALPTADPLTRLHLIQERTDLNAAMAGAESTVDIAAIESDFVAVAKSYGQRKGIDYATWRELGVPRAVLQKAGITKTG
ncbi:MAG: hypothetical protein HYR89_08770 [Actinobacteria bacterium]|nr:hypothetical protein [Actinomycetota bacterium]